MEEMNEKLAAMSRPRSKDLYLSPQPPFTKDILAAPLPKGFEIPQFELYDGTSDPIDHLFTFKILMQLYGFSDAIMCRAFPVTLRKAAIFWYSQLKPNSVSSFRELSVKFVNHFIGSHFFPARYSQSLSPRRRPRSRSRSESPSRSGSRGRSPSPNPRYRSRSRSGSHGRNSASDPGNTLYVTGLSSRVTERDLEDHFSKEGMVVECCLVVHPRTRISRGFAFVTMDTNENAGRCIKYLNKSVLEGRHITVEKSRRKRPRTPTPGNYLGMKNTRESSYRSDRGRYRGGYGGRDDYGGGYRRSPRRSPSTGGRQHSLRQSPFGGGMSRRERSRSLPYSPYGSPARGYDGRSNVYAR